MTISVYELSKKMRWLGYNLGVYLPEQLLHDWIITRMIDDLCTANNTSQNNGDRNAESPPNPIWFPLWSLIQTEIAQTAPPTALSNSYERELGDHEASWFSKHKAFLSPRKFIMNWRTWQKVNIIAISSAHTIDRNGICAVDSRDTHPWFAPTRRARLCIKYGHFSLSCVAIKCRTCSFWKWVKVAFRFLELAAKYSTITVDYHYPCET